MEFTPLSKLQQIYNECEGGPCLIVAPTLEEQLNLLKRVAALRPCSFSPSLRDEIGSVLSLVDDAHTSYLTEPIFLKNANICAIKMIVPLGYDASLRNVKYIVATVKDDRFLAIRFSLFPIGVFSEIDQIWRSLGYDFYNNSCDLNCIERQDKYFSNLESKQFSMEPLKEVIHTYDEVVSTIDF